MEGSDIIYIGIRRNRYESHCITSLLVVLREQVHNGLHLVLRVRETFDELLLDRDTKIVAILHERYPQKDPQSERVENGNSVADFLLQIVRDIDEQLIVN